MRAVLLFSLCLVPLASANTAFQAPAQVEHEEHFDLVKVMHDLFTDRQNRAISNEDEDTEAAAEGNKGDNLTPVTDKATEKKYNQLVDDIYQGMNQRLKSDGMDPMVLDLDKAKTKAAQLKKKKEEKKEKKVEKKSHSVEKREAVEDEIVEEAVAEVDEEEARKMKMNPKHKAAAGHGKKNKATKKKHEEEKKKKAGKTNNKKKEKKDSDAKKKAEHGKKKAEHGKKKAEKKEKKNKEEKKNKKNHEAKKGDNKESHKQKRSLQEMGSLSGIASLKRHGDVEVFRNEEGHEIVKSEFFIGPLNLEVTKSTHGNGKAKNVKVARAVTEKLKGKMVIKVKPDGSTVVKSVQFEKPQQVNVRGSLGFKSTESKHIAERSYARLRPVAAQRLLKIAKSIVRNKTKVEKQ